MKQSLFPLAFGLLSISFANAQAAEQPVMETPAGNLRNFIVSSTSYSSQFGLFISADFHDGFHREVVFGDDGVTVWFKDPITSYLTGAWIKGELKDDIITVDTPQLIKLNEKSDGTIEPIYVQRLKNVVIDGKKKWVIDEETAMTYTFRNDSIISNEPEVMLGLIDGEDGALDPIGIGETNVIYAKVQEKVSKMPEGEAELWSWNYYPKQASQIEVMFDNNEMYMTGFWDDQPTACIKGRVEGNKVYFPSKQYLGRITDQETYNDYYVYFMSAQEGESDFITPYIPLSDELEFDYDPEAKTLVLTNEDRYAMVKYGKNTGYESTSHAMLKGQIKMAHIDELDVPATPSFDMPFFRYDLEYGWGSIEVNIPMVDVKGNALLRDNMSYSVYLDDKKLIFDEEDALYENYKGLGEPTDELPYMFRNDLGIDYKTYPNKRYLMFYKLDFEKFGVQSYYTDPATKEKTSSKIAYYNRLTEETSVADTPQSASLESTVAEREIENVTYADLTGRNVMPDYKGVCVKTVRYTDGTVMNSKVVRK